MPYMVFLRPRRARSPSAFMIPIPATLENICYLTNQVDVLHRCSLGQKSLSKNADKNPAVDTPRLGGGPACGFSNASHLQLQRAPCERTESHAPPPPQLVSLWVWIRHLLVEQAPQGWEQRMRVLVRTPSAEMLKGSNLQGRISMGCVWAATPQGDLGASQG